MFFGMSGCISRKSVAHKTEFQPLIGEYFRTTDELFLVKGLETYTIETECSDTLKTLTELRYRSPTFEEFRNGAYKHSWRETREFLAILPKGTIFRTTDVIRENHIEVGTSWEIHSVILDPPEFKDTQPVVLCDIYGGQTNWVKHLEKVHNKRVHSIADSVRSE